MMARRRVGGKIIDPSNPKRGGRIWRKELDSKMRTANNEAKRGRVKTVNSLNEGNK